MENNKNLGYLGFLGFLGIQGIVGIATEIMEWPPSLPFFVSSSFLNILKKNDFFRS
jgi:hypothetical protein